MFLTSANIVHYLTARGFVKLSDVVDGQFCVIEAGQHNRNFKVMLGTQSGLFIKQIQVVDKFSQTSLLKESQCYLWAQNYPDWAQTIPVLIDYDPNRHSLILELICDSQNLREYYNQKNVFPENLARLLAQSLSSFHYLHFDPQEVDLAIPHLEKKVPWIFTYYKKSYFPSESLSKGAIQFAEVLRGMPQLTSHLDRIFLTWRLETLIHSDIKWDNCLVFHNAGVAELKIIDWELIDFGDERWDVGAVFQAYLSHWIMRCYRDRTQLREQLVQATITQMPTMFASIKTFWVCYCDGIKLLETGRSEHLLRCLEFGAIRMLGTAFESLHGTAEVSQHVYALIELSHRILDDPAQAAIAMFGFTAEDT
jgi:hypothetical protein